VLLKYEVFLNTPASPLRLLYLDYDGVLHDAEVFQHPKRGIYIATPGHILFEWMSILEQILAPHPTVRIVLSTSWVRMKGFTYAKRQLSPNLQSKVIGATFHKRHMNSLSFAERPRGVQILGDVIRRRPTSWLAIDDEYEGWPEAHIERLICTDGARGLSERAVQDELKQKLKIV